jgi:hypothetical protein
MGDFAEDMIQGRTCPIAVACLRKARFLLVCNALTEADEDKKIYAESHEEEL